MAIVGSSSTSLRWTATSKLLTLRSAALLPSSEGRGSPRLTNKRKRARERGWLAVALAPVFARPFFNDRRPREDSHTSRTHTLPFAQTKLPYMRTSTKKQYGRGEPAARRGFVRNVPLFFF